MEIELDTTKSAAKNASELFQKAKKLEAKSLRAKEILKKLAKKMENAKVNTINKKDVMKERKKREWFEKFRWFTSSTGKLVIGGRDATSNEVVMKKNTEENELCFHADIVGAPFFVIKGEADKQTIEETIHAAGIFSKAWTGGYGSVNVFYAPRTQFSKQAPSGEYISKGGFMVRGKREWGKAILKTYIGIKDGIVICGPKSAIEPWADKMMGLEPGDLKPGEIIKKASRWLKIDADEIQRVIPSGKSKILVEKKK